MIRMENHLGCISVSDEYFANLIGKTASGCFGVAGMAASSPAQGLRALIEGKDTRDKGVKIRYTGNKLIVDLHIVITYGVNVSAIVKSIMNKVRYTIEDVTGLSVAKVNVFVDDMIAE